MLCTGVASPRTGLCGSTGRQTTAASAVVAAAVRGPAGCGSFRRVSGLGNPGRPAGGHLGTAGHPSCLAACGATRGQHGAGLAPTRKRLQTGDRGWRPAAGVRDRGRMRAITDKSSDEGVQTSVAPAPTAIVAPHGRTGDTSRKGEGARQQDSGIHVQEGRSGDGEWDGDHDENKDGDGEEMMFGLPRKRVFEPLSILLSSQLILFVGVGALLPALPLYAQSIGLNGSANGIVLSAPALAMLFLNLPAGRLVDSWGRKQMMMAGMLVIALSDLATSQCRTVLALVPARLSLGAGRSAAEGGDRAYLADLSDRFPEARGTISGTQQAVHALGLVIGPLIGGRVAEQYGASSVFYLISGAALICTAGYSLLPDINASEEKREENLALSMDMSEEEEEEFEREQQAVKVASSWGELLKSNRQRVITFAAGANAFGFVAKLTCIPWFATASLGATPQQVGELFSLTALLGLASAPVGGIIADKIGLKAVIVTSLAACAVGLGLAQEAADVRQLQMCVGLWGMGTAAAGPAVNALAQESAPKGGEGEALTLPKTAADSVFLIGPVVLGLVDDRLGAAGASLWLVSGSAALAAAATLVFLRPLGEEDTVEA